MVKRVSARRVKAHRQYTYEGAADALGVTVQTVRSWRKEELLVLDSQKPHLLLGYDLKDFLQQRGARASHKLAPGQFYCMSCRAPGAAYGDMADYIPIEQMRGRLVALCAECETMCCKFLSTAATNDLSSILTIVTRDSG